MASVIVISSAGECNFHPWRHATAFLLKHSAELDIFGKHKLVEDPEEADIILFAEMGECGAFAERVRAHPYYARFPDKCFLFDSGDSTFPVMPGIYASLTEERYRLDHTRTGFYLYMIENAFILYRPLTGKEKYLASFVGSRTTHPVRRKFFEFNREDIFVKDTSAYSGTTTYHGEPDERERFWSEYADSLADAKFSLCPRGKGAGSIRLFESMKMGRACVIVSDAWHPNDGVDWNSFSIRVPESEASRIPEILEQYAHRAAEMGNRARTEWENWFSEKVRFHRVVELCLDIRRARQTHSSMRRYYHLRYIPLNLRRYLSSKKALYRNSGKIYW
jgi:hypothetical protein